MKKFSDGIFIPFDPKSICLSTFFYPALRNGDKAAFQWIRIALRDQNLLSDEGFAATEILIPIIIDESHWILVTLDVTNKVYFTINPYHPTRPSQEELEMAEFCAQNISEEFGLQEFGEKHPRHIHHLPIQDDTYNCGVYIAMYMVIYSFGLNAVEFHGEPLKGQQIQSARLLVLAWILRGLIYFP